MGRLVLVRHAQASFLSDNYDRLSSLGVRQARLLGDHWVRRKFVFDRVWTGPAARHRRTAEIVRAAFTEAGLAFGEPATIDELDEFDGEAVLEKNLPGLLACDSNIRQMQDALENANDDAHKRANFQRLF